MAATGISPHGAEGQGQGDEAGAGHAAGSLGSEHGHRQQDQFLAEGQMDVGGLGQEEGRQGHVDVGAVEIERIARRHHQPDDRARRAQTLQLGHQLRQHRLGGRGAQDDEQLLADVEQEAPQREAGQAGHGAQHHRDEKDAGQIDAADQGAQLEQRGRAILADGEGHGPEGSHRRGAHDDAHHGEEHLADPLQGARPPRRRPLESRQGEPGEDGQQQHLQHLALGEGRDEGVRDQAQQISR